MILKPCADITISRGPGFDPRARQQKEVPINTLVCSCGSFVELSSGFRSLSGDNLALASHPRGWAQVTFWAHSIALPQVTFVQLLLLVFSAVGGMRTDRDRRMLVLTAYFPVLA